MLLHDILAHNKRHNGASRALVADDGTTLTFSALHDRAMQLAHALGRFGKVGDHVAILADNVPEYVEAYYGVPAAGQRLVFLNYRLAATELSRIMNDAGASRLFYAPRFVHLVESLNLDRHVDKVAFGEEYENFIAIEPVEPPEHGLTADAVAWMIYTSGTTGMPKGAMLSHRNLFAALFNANISNLGEPPLSPCYLFPFPLCHIAGHALLAQHLLGNPVVLMAQFATEAWMQKVDEYRITGTALAPTMINMLLNDPAINRYDLGSLTTLGYGASSIPASVLSRAMERFGPIFTQGFGMTELAGNVIFMSKADHIRANTSRPDLLRAAGRIGRLAQVRLVNDEGKECAVDEPGEIVVRGDQVLTGYWNRPEANAASLRDGWFHTGDVGRRDSEGFVYIVDRKKDMIVSGGENVYPREVEDVLHQHGAVREAAVFGVPDEHWGELVSAAVVLHHGSNATEAELDAWCREQLAGYKRPRAWHFVDELPKNVSGKILKRELRDRFPKRTIN